MDLLPDTGPPWQAKCWGWTREVPEAPPFFRNDPRLSTWQLFVTAGGFCSVHTHRKTNEFYVESGVVLVQLWINPEDPPGGSVLEPGFGMRVSPGTPHRFCVLESGWLWEQYIPPHGQDKCDPNDIHRMRPGGHLRKPGRRVRPGTDDARPAAFTPEDFLFAAGNP